MYLPGPFGPIVMLPYVNSHCPALPAGQPLMLQHGFSHLGGLDASWAQSRQYECALGSPTMRRRPRRGKGGPSRGRLFGMAPEPRKGRAKAACVSAAAMPAAVAPSNFLDSDPRALAEDANLSSFVLTQLEKGNKAKRSAILGWLHPVVLELALSVHGCRVIQQALEVASGEVCGPFAEELHGHVQELLESQHGNHVLQKCIEMLPPCSIQFIFDELAYWPLSWVGVSKHRFGCRVLERLLEHCPEDMTLPLVEAVVGEANALARHPYGNYVVQHALEYGNPAHRSRLVAAFVESGIAFLAQHRIASNVIEKAIGQVCTTDQQTIGLALIAAPQTLLVMGCSRYGTSVVQSLLEVLSPGPLRGEAIRQLVVDLPQLKASKHSKQLVEKLTSLGYE